MRLKPDLADAHLNIAALLNASGERLPDAIRHLEAAIKLAPDNAEAPDLLAQLRSKR